ncbi:unnamed protein product [Chrysoparadoxa australica]
MYTEEPQDDYLDAALVTCIQIHTEEAPGDVLVFLPGQEDIESLSMLLEEALNRIRKEEARKQANDDGLAPARQLSMEALVCPIYAALPQERQLEAFEPAPPNTRKFVLATNIAETSITINGVRYVVDPGFVKTRAYQSNTGMEQLKVVPVSKAQAQQRAGRAGREAPGTAFRLFTEDKYLDLPKAIIPEIQRVNLVQVVLQLKVIGINDPGSFDFISPPLTESLVVAMQSLYMLKALDKKGKLTEHGKRMAQLPLEPAYAHLLLMSADPDFHCTKEVLEAVSCLSADNVLVQPQSPTEARAASIEAHKRLAAWEGDLLTMCNVFQAYNKANGDRGWCRQNFVNHRSLVKALDVKDQLSRILSQRLKVDVQASCGDRKHRFLCCWTASLCMNVATRLPVVEGQKKRGAYRTLVGGKEVYIHPSSSLFGRNPPPKCVLYCELLITKKQYMKQVTAVEQAWLTEYAPEHFRTKVQSG